MNNEGDLQNVSDNTDAPQQTMNSTPPQPSNENLPKKKHWRRNALIVAISALFLAVIVLLVQHFVIQNQNEAVIEDGITIGDITITKETVDKNVSGMQAAVDDNPDMSFGEGDVRSIAIDNLLLNAALKDEANKCGLTITKEDIIKNAEFVSDAEHYESLEDYSKVIAENKAYEKLAKKCILQYKEVFRVIYQYDAPYYGRLNGEQLKAAFDYDKQRLETIYMPLFRQGKSTEEIVALVAQNMPSIDPAQQYNYVYNNPAFAIADISDVDNDNHAYNDIMDLDYPVELGEVVSINEAIAKLTKVGQYTDVLTGADGTFSISRLDNISGGAYKDYDEFLSDIK
jgi:hypothetical protein